MSDYSRLTFFKPKDALTSGDPNKVIYGAELDPEFAAISTAIATKYDDTNLSDQAQAEAGTNNTTLMTPLRVRQATDFYILAGATSPGIDVTLGEISVDITSADAATGLDDTTDLVLLYDASAGKNVKVSIADFVGAGSSGLVPITRELTTDQGLLGGGDLSADRTFSLDPADDRNVDHSAVSVIAGDGLSGGGDITATRTLDLDFNSLPAAAPTSLTTDFIAFESTVSLPGYYKASMEDLNTILSEAAAGEPQTVTVITQANYESSTTAGDTDVVTKGNFETSLGTKGSIKLPGGLLLNWGSKSVAGSTTDTDTYNTAYGSAPNHFQASQEDVQDEADGAVGARAGSTTEITLENGYTGAQVIHWLALGPA